MNLPKQQADLLRKARNGAVIKQPMDRTGDLWVCDDQDVTEVVNALLEETYLRTHFEHEMGKSLMASITFNGRKALHMHESYQ